MEQPQQIPITPEEYNSFVGKLKPVDLRLISCSFELVNSNETAVLVKADADPATKFDKADSHAYESDLHQLSQKIRFELQDGKSGVIARGSCSISVRVSLEGTPPAAFWEIFRRRNMPLYVNPAVRDLIHSLSIRAGLHATLLPTIAVLPTLPLEEQKPAKPAVARPSRPKTIAAASKRKQV